MTILETSGDVVPPVGGVKIAVKNLSTIVSESEIQAVTRAIQIQVSRDFYSTWGMNAEFHYFPPKAILPTDMWQFIYMNDADVANALGYHDLTSSGLPLSKIFVRTTLSAGHKWSVTASHEALEMLADPYVNLVAFNQHTNTTGLMVAYEVCDAVEDDDSGYNIGGIRVSNFVLPEWFEEGFIGKVDFLSQLTRGLELGDRGYKSTFSSTPETTGWTRTFGHARPENMVYVSDRLALKSKPQTQRIRSTI
jgi:hypothetical protein